MLKVVNLPVSKSELNRKIILSKLYDNHLPIIDETMPDDVKLLYNLISDNNLKIFNCNNAGTVLRFLLATLSIDNTIELPITICGNKRMSSRPILDLVNVLTNLGAKIKYINESGFPPLELIQHANLKNTNNIISFNRPISSQYISALMMIAPKFVNGLKIQYKDIPSFSYVEMTSKMMNSIGLDNTIQDNIIIVEHNSSQIITDNIIVEKDWSAAANWYPILFISNQNQLLLKDLHKNSFQGDEIITEIMSSFGFITTDTPDGIIIKKQVDLHIDNNKKENVFHLINTPDLLPVVIIMSVLSGKKTTIDGLRNLKWKESDRYKIIVENMKRLNINIDCISENEIIINCPNSLQTINKIKYPIYLNSAEDHRIAMAFMPFSKLNKYIHIDSVKCVSKSYPNFIQELSNYFITFA